MCLTLHCSVQRFASPNASAVVVAILRFRNDQFSQFLSVFVLDPS
jgi:hypothetical protein